MRNHCLILMTNFCLILKMNFRLIRMKNYGMACSCLLILKMNCVKEYSFRSNAMELLSCFAEAPNTY
jgi:hypothetical protein